VPVSQLAVNPNGDEHFFINMEKVSGEVDNLLNSQSNPAVLEDEMHDQLSNVTNVNKPIERIIILYTDKTFEVFNRRN
ncbi:MAG TPA: hypothetical protein PLF75_09155, partial [Bacteroidales bacterium]|nr:hypothetical protein [Bacteroidales bacterium]